MGNQAVKEGVKVASKKGVDRLDPSPYKTLLEVPVKALFSPEPQPIGEQIAQPKKLYLCVNSASK